MRHLTETELWELTFPELRRHAVAIGGSSITRIGQKANLIQAILRYQQQIEARGQETPKPARCESARDTDPEPCSGEPAVLLVDKYGGTMNACIRHGVKALRAIQGSRVYPIDEAHEGAAIEVFNQVHPPRVTGMNVTERYPLGNSGPW